MDIRAVLNSATTQLWKYFPNHKLEPILVTRGHRGPIALYKRTSRGEIVVQLDTQGTFWCQYAFQFTTQFCHILCGFREDELTHKWFEQSLCQTAALFAMRAMAKSWADSPPYPNWQGYHDALHNYTDDVFAKNHYSAEIPDSGMPKFYAAHRAQLELGPTSYDLNGAMAILLLRMFERQPAQWQAVRWLNAFPAKKNNSFRDYLHEWRNAAPQANQKFINSIIDLYSTSLPPGRLSDNQQSRN